MSELQFFDELPFTPGPSRAGHPATYDRESRLLMDNPGKWARIKTFEPDQQTPAKQRAQNLKSVIARKQYKAFRTEGSWESAIRELDSGAVEVWARWLDTKDPAPRDPSLAPKASPRKRGSR